MRLAFLLLGTWGWAFVEFLWAFILFIVGRPICHDLGWSFVELSQAYILFTSSLGWAFVELLWAYILFITGQPIVSGLARLGMRFLLDLSI